MRKNIKKIVSGAAIGMAACILGGCTMSGSVGTKTTQGYAALEDEDYAQALTLFQEAVREGEEEVPAYRGLGMTYLGMADYGAAEEVFLAALDCTDTKMEENIRDLQLYLATTQFREEKYDETIDTCNTILAGTEEGNADAYYLKGASCLHENQQEEAASSFDAAVALASDDYDLYLNIYECYKQQNLSGIGGQYLQSALNIQGDDMESNYNRGRVYFYLEDYEQAQSLLIGPVEQKYEPAMYLIGKVYLALEDYGHAKNTYEQIVNEYGVSVASYNGQAMCALASGDYSGALSYINKGLALEGTAGKQELYLNEIIAYERMLEFGIAKTKAQQYVERYPADEAGQREWTFLSTR